MLNASDTSAHTCSDKSFPKRLRSSLALERPLLDALAVLRSLGDEGTESVEAISALRRIKTIKLSWQLWESLAEGEGLDSEALLLYEIPVGTLDRDRDALFGSWRGDPSSAHLRAV